MPELPEVESVRRTLESAIRGARIDRVVLRRSNLRRPFPTNFAARLQGQTIGAIDRRGKYLLVRLGSGDTLLVHLGMSGSFRMDGSRNDRHDHVVFELSTGVVAVFNDPRRFGVMDLLTTGVTDGGSGLKALGPEPLDNEFDAKVLARACARKRTALKLALLDQRIVAGVGNIYAGEALHRAGLLPRRRSSTIATRSGLPREAAFRLAAAIKVVLREAIERQERPYRSGRFRVYEREGEPCRRRGCSGTIRRIVQAGRSTFYCPVCQR